MSKINATVVADSINPQGDRLTSLLITFPRILLSEVNTHRMLSKNTSSSRAIPFAKMVETVKNDPFIPIAVQWEHKGMQGDSYLPERDYEAFVASWLHAKEKAVLSAEQLHGQGATKQLVNRLLEPFMWTTMLITGSREGWDNFFHLRCPQYHSPVDTHFRHKSKKDCIAAHSNPINLKIFDEMSTVDWLKINEGQAEIHMMSLAECIWDAVNESKPKQLQSGEWHVPFGDKISSEVTSWSDDIKVQADLLGRDLSLHKVKVSTAMAAHTSYTIVGNEPVKDYSKWIELHDKLIAYNPPHCFTEGTEILTNKGWIDFRLVNKETDICAVNVNNLQFNGFEKPINIINESYDGKVFNLAYGNIMITPNHKLLGIKVTKSSDRTKDYSDIEIINPTNSLNNKDDIFRELRMFSAVNPIIDIKNVDNYYKGKFLGFFLGDGSAKYTTSVYFHLKKERKIEYIKEVIAVLNLSSSIRIEKDGTTTIKVNTVDDYTNYYNSNKHKYIPEEFINYDIDFIKGLFDGLKNSDGSIKRDTWIYDTYSKDLKDLILRLCPIIGLTGIEYFTYEHYRIGFTTNNKILFNDSRKNENKVREEYYEGNIYCVEIPSNGIIIRKNGKVLITHNSSPMEHCARAMTNDEYNTNIKGQLSLNCVGSDIILYESDRDTKDHLGWCYNLKGFISYRYMIDNKYGL